jgi:hypothetical protein
MTLVLSSIQERKEAEETAWRLRDIITRQAKLIEAYMAKYGPLVELEPDTEWRDVVGFEGVYKVSNAGRVINVKSTFPLKSFEGGGSYWRVWLHDHRGRRKLKSIHTLVLEAFVCPKPAGMEASHKDGYRHNNALSNLEWTTKKENHAMKLLHGTLRVGEKSLHSKLKNEDVLCIVSRVKSGESRRLLAKEYGVNATSIDKIMRGKTWGHTTGIVYEKKMKESP